MRNFLALLMLLALLSSGGCGHKKKKGAPQAAPALELEVVKASTENFRRKMDFPGRIYPNHEAVIQPRANGFILSKEFTDGMPVRKGQVLYRIDDPQSRSSVAAAQATVTSAQAALTEAENNYRRAVPLAGIDAISKSALDQYTATYESAKANLRSAQAQLQNARVQLGYSTIYAPLDGIINSIAVSAGDYVGPGTKYSSLNTVTDTDTVKVEISMPVSTYLNLRGPGTDSVPTYDNSRFLSDIRLTLPDGTPYPYPGTYAYTQNNPGNEMGTIVFVVRFPNPEGILKAGQFINIAAGVGVESDVVLVPQQSVMQQQGTASVWIVEPDSTLSYRAVTLGNTFGPLWIIEKGVMPGETVLAGGIIKARGGMKIKPVYAGVAQATQNAVPSAPDSPKAENRRSPHPNV